MLARLLLAILTVSLPFDLGTDRASFADDSPARTDSGEAARDRAQDRRPLVLAHYMPWYAASPSSGQWGWHWTMNHFDPEKQIEGKREIASEFYPLIGPYDSGDPKVLEYHLLLMKLAGIDGVIVDWYGLEDFRDYALLHRNTSRLVEQIERFKMKLVICYEDQTIPALVEGKRLASSERVSHARSEINWLIEHWFRLDSYVRIHDRPVLLSFGHTGLNDREWKECLSGIDTPVAYFSEHDLRSSAVGAFDWPIPSSGVGHVDSFLERARGWPAAIPVVYPRFVDIYAKAGVNEGYGRIDDRGGETFRFTLERAIDSHRSLIQIATWNDWGEGTQIEPCVEYGYRDLEVLQQVRRERLDPNFKPNVSDLRLPLRLFELRQRQSSQQQNLDEIADWLINERLAEARKGIENLVEN